MDKRPLNVLSIDFDFFQKVKSDTIRNYYPDGHDLGTDLSIAIWGGYYANPKSAKELHKIRINRQALRKTKDIIKTNSEYLGNDCKTMIVNSHRHIYDFIKDNFDKKKYSGIEVYNLDLHHDMFDTTVKLSYKNNKQVVEYETNAVNCANWATCIKRDFKNSNIHWICNPISQKLYPCRFMDTITDNLNELTEINFDLIFLCRSDIYLPPHLDKAFDELRKTIQGCFSVTLVEGNILRPRDMSETINTYKTIYRNYDSRYRKV